MMTAAARKILHNNKGRSLIMLFVAGDWMVSQMRHSTAPPRRDLNAGLSFLFLSASNFSPNESFLATATRTSQVRLEILLDS